jgi:hypothetical protein
MAALLLAGCASDGTVYESTYEGDVPVSGAVMQETPNGGYRTVVGIPLSSSTATSSPNPCCPTAAAKKASARPRTNRPITRRISSLYIEARHRELVPAALCQNGENIFCAIAQAVSKDQFRGASVPKPN